MAKKYDFSGWATKNDLKCSDGRTIRKNAFKENDGQTVPLVWNHQHNDSDNVLGHALLENRPEGVYAYCSFNDTEKGQNAKLLVQHGDITGLSIYANKLKQSGGDVLHGLIREVSLVLAGANPGAFIDSIMAHGEESDEEGVIYTGEEIALFHAEEDEDPEEPDEEDPEDPEEPEEPKEAEKETPEEPKGEPEVVEHSEKKETEKPMDGKEKTVQDVIDSMSEEQKNVMYALVGMAAERKGAAGEDEKMKHNVFDQDEDNREDVISHSEVMAAVADGKRFGSLKESFIEHGIDNIEYLFPDNKNLTNTPGFINTHPAGWIDVVMNGVHHTPFSRVKMQFADITMSSARAKGYIKGNLKIDEQFSLLKRTVNPCTVYKKQKLDRDDVVDITDFDVIAWLKGEMRLKLDEELARAFIFGDGRVASDDDKINEQCIIPVYADTTNNLYAMAYTVTPASGESEGHAIINAMVKAMDDYEGSGNVVAFINQGKVSDMLLLEDNMGHRLYKGLDDLAAGMSVNKIVKCPSSIMPEGCLCVALDLRDYNVGADKGGAVNMFDDFDIDYNAQKYLIETRCSGALTLPHSAIVLNAAD